MFSFLKTKDGKISKTKIAGALYGLGTLADGAPVAFPVAGAWAPLVSIGLKSLAAVLGGAGVRDALSQ